MGNTDHLYIAEDVIPVYCNMLHLATVIPGEYASEAVKLGNILFVQEEFTVYCKEDWELFEICYPGLFHQYTKLLKAVCCACQEHGEAKCCHSCKHL